MRIEAATFLPDLIRRAPACRPVLGRHGLAACEGRYGPHETVGSFARAHQVDLESLLGELRAAAESRTQGAAARRRRQLSS